MARISRWLWAAALGTCITLGGCDDNDNARAMGKLKDIFNSVKPDTLLLKDLKPGVTTEEQIREQMGKPETERRFDNGVTRLEYPRGPAGDVTYFVDIDTNGTLLGVNQVLNADTFAKVQIGMSEAQVRALLGKPGEIAEYPLKPETVWSWKWREGGVTPDAFFNVHFDATHLVYTTSRSDVIRGH